MNKLIYSINSFFKKNGQQLLSYGSIAGVITTAVLSANDTLKAVDIFNELDTEDKKEKLKAAAVCYIPTFIAVSSTIAMIATNNHLTIKTEAQLLDAYISTKGALEQYKNGVIAAVGEEAEAKIEEKLYPREYDVGDEHEDGEELFYDEYSHKFFYSTMTDVTTALYHVNRNFILRGYVPVNEYYDFLGIDHIPTGDVEGWSWDNFAEDGLQWIDFAVRKVKKDDVLPYWQISMIFDPDILFKS